MDRLGQKKLIIFAKRERKTFIGFGRPNIEIGIMYLAFFFQHSIVVLFIILLLVLAGLDTVRLAIEMGFANNN